MYGIWGGEVRGIHRSFLRSHDSLACISHATVASYQKVVCTGKNNWTSNLIRLVPSLQGMESFFHDDSTLWSLLTPAFPCDNIFIESVEVIRVLIVLVFWCSAHGLIIVDFARRRNIIFRMSMVASFVASRCETLFRCSRSCLLGVSRSLVSCTISAAYLSSLRALM